MKKTRIRVFCVGLLFIVLLCVGLRLLFLNPVMNEQQIMVGKFKRQTEALQRGIIARDGVNGGVFISWRNLVNEPDETTYNVYRNGVRLNNEPLKVSNFEDENGTMDDIYFVCAVINGKEQGRSEGVNPFKDYLEIPVQKPEPQTTQITGEVVDYIGQKANIADLDGDGEYELVMFWIPENAKDNGSKGVTAETFIDAYKMDGTKLWRISMGPNIRSGEHYTQPIIYDLDGDGKAEIALRTADGTVDGQGNIIGDKNARYVNNNGFIITGPEYLSVFEGETGKVLVTQDFSPERGDVSRWGDSYGNRCDRFLACVAYLDGKRPSFVMARGYYTNTQGTLGRTAMTAYNWRDGELSVVWEYVADLGENINPDYVGQGNHSMVAADVNNDGLDDIIYGGIVIDNNGKGIYSTKRGHGDAMHVGFFQNNGRLQIVKANEDPKTYNNMAVEYRYADDGEVIMFGPGTKDNGRTVVADVDPTIEGPAIFAGGGAGNWRYVNGNWEKWDIKGFLNAFPIWWDGDLLRELSEGIYKDVDNKRTYPGYKTVKYNWETKIFDEVMNITGVISSRRPLLQADLFGDWREEILLVDEDGSNVRVYTTNIPTEYNIPCLMQDPKYRLDIATQSSGYSQPPWPGFYIGHNNFEIPPKARFTYNKIPSPIIKDSFTPGDNQ